MYPSFRICGPKSYSLTSDHYVHKTCLQCQLSPRHCYKGVVVPVFSALPGPARYRLRFILHDILPGESNSGLNSETGSSTLPTQIIIPLK
jgi:hypothetical protein